MKCDILRGSVGRIPQGSSYMWKKIALHGHLKPDIPGHKQGIHAPVLSPKHAALEVTAEEDIPNGAFSAPHF